MDDTEKNEILMETDDPSWLTFSLLLSDRKLFEKLFDIFNRDSDSGDAKRQAVELMESAARTRGLDFISYMELLTDFAYWIRDLSVLAHIQGK